MVKATPLVYRSVRKKRIFGVKLQFFCANLIEIRVKRSKVNVMKWSYLDSPDRLLRESDNWFCGKTMFQMLSNAVSLAYSIAKATFLELYE